MTDVSYQVGDAVTVRQHLYEAADEDHLGGYLAMHGDKLIVRKVGSRGHWPFSVSHEDRTDGITFTVAAAEIEPYK